MKVSTFLAFLLLPVVVVFIAIAANAEENSIIPNSNQEGPLLRKRVTTIVSDTDTEPVPRVLKGMHSSAFGRSRALQEGDEPGRKFYLVLFAAFSLCHCFVSLSVLSIS